MQHRTKVQLQLAWVLLSTAGQFDVKWCSHNWITKTWNKFKICNVLLYKPLQWQQKLLFHNQPKSVLCSNQVTDAGEAPKNLNVSLSLNFHRNAFMFLMATAVEQKTCLSPGNIAWVSSWVVSHYLLRSVTISPLMVLQVWALLSKKMGPSYKFSGTFSKKWTKTTHRSSINAKCSLNLTFKKWVWRG